MLQTDTYGKRNMDKIVHSNNIRSSKRLKTIEVFFNENQVRELQDLEIMESHSL